MNSKDGVMVDRTFKLKLPLRIRTSSKKKQAMNLNVYRNLHFRSLSAQKNRFYALAKKLLLGLPPLGVITLHYVINPGSKRRLDIMNVGSIVDKYFSDALTQSGIIEDDDYTHIPHVSFSFGSTVKSEHILVTITEIELRKGNPHMRVLLDQTDILKALTAYVTTMNIPNATGVELSMKDSDIQGEIIAEVTFELVENDPLALNTEEHNAPPLEGDTSESTKPRRVRRTKAQIEADNAAKEAANVDEIVQDGSDISSGGDDSGAEKGDPEASTEEPNPKGNARKNLFETEESPSSEDDGKPEAPSDSVSETPVKRGSIFDA